MPFVWGLISALLVVGFTEYAVVLDSDRAIEHQRSELTQHLSTVRARLEGEINSTLHLTRGLIAYVATHPEINNSEFEQLAAEITIIGRHIRNIGLARDNVLSYIYPLAGNEAALGLRYRENPKQWPAVERAMQLGSTIVASPVDLMQGGRAFIARTPIYLRPNVGGLTSDGKLHYWGIASIVIEVPSLFSAAKVLFEDSNYEIALRGRDGLGDLGDIIFGDIALFDEDAIEQEVTIPNGSWRLAARPNNGWQVPGWIVLRTRIIGWLVAVAVGILLVLLLIERRRAHESASHDYLTGLPNRRLLQDYFEVLVAAAERNHLKFGILYIDLNNFKPINDKHGHLIGDKVLIEMGRILSRTVRNEDIVARIGGDEFVVVLSNPADLESLQRVVASVRRDLDAGVVAGAHRFKLSAGIGEAIYPKDGLTIDALLKRADSRMYSDKRSANLINVDFENNTMQE
ncbi:hypothetical protein BOW53_10270 [Solemya pervernicosa gill symbiont]|uniref:Sensor domain-containing diguanylate cyclase n=1 Tax=Solemya pervernicosa gill symbiont TaxID=642797 RepID=A0A1T2L415_9GAMM|nr:hypothetical protein BOW53_10270 [Solemya pervernicosa gill symbiont]